MEQLQQSPETLQSEIEVKYLVNPNSFPQDLLEALEKGKDHKDILRKGRITQIYLPVTEENQRLALDIIQKHSIEPLTVREIEHFSDIKNIVEIRILQREELNPAANDEFYLHTLDEDCDLDIDIDKMLSQRDTNDNEDESIEEEINDEEEEEKKTKGKVRVPDWFQVTIKGKANVDGTSRPNIETPISPLIEICDTVVDLLEASKENAWTESGNKIEKMWYDIQIPHPTDPSLTAVAELDIFPDLNYLAIAEVEFDPGTDLEAAKNNLPEWFYQDVTDNPDFKVRNLVGIQDVEDIETTNEELASVITEVRSNLRRFYQGTVLGENLKISDKDAANTTFVVLGSFKRFIPQFRRIVQDLERRSGGVYPPISTLDVARRQSSKTTDHNDAAFRIESEESDSLYEAEQGYLERISKSDAVIVVAPDKRLGKSSSQELVYAIAKGKEAYLSGPVERVADDVAPAETRVLISTMIRYFISNLYSSLQSTDISPLISDHVRSIYRKDDGSFDKDAVKKMVEATVNDLLESCIKEDAKRKELNAKLQKERAK